MPERLRMGVAGGRRVGALVDARSAGRRTLDVAQDAGIVPRLGLVVEMRRRRERQQRERGNRAPLQQRRPDSPHGSLVARFARFRQGRHRARRTESRREFSAAARREGLQRAAMRTDGTSCPDPPVEPHPRNSRGTPRPISRGARSLDARGVVPIQHVRHVAGRQSGGCAGTRRPPRTAADAPAITARQANGECGKGYAGGARAGRRRK